MGLRSLVASRKRGTLRLIAAVCQKQCSLIRPSHTRRTAPSFHCFRSPAQSLRWLLFVFVARGVDNASTDRRPRPLAPIIDQFHDLAHPLVEESAAQLTDVVRLHAQ